MPWYRGDLHTHTRRSHGADLTPAQVVREARSAGLDFIAITEHDTVDGHPDWAPFAGDLLVIPGQEVVTRTGHWLAIGTRRFVDGRYGIRDGLIDDELDRVRDAGGICVAAHPHAPYPGGQLAYSVDLFDAVEVWNGRWASALPWQADNAAALAEWGRRLAAGRWRPAVGSSDAHLAGQLGSPQTVVRARTCSEPDLIAAIRGGHCWIAASAEVSLVFTVATGAGVAGPGELLAVDGAAATVAVAVTGVPGGVVRVHTERGVAHEAPADAPVSVEVAETAFVWVSVRSATGAPAALANPVVLG